MTNPRLLTIPFADTGTKNEIPVSGATEPQLATFQAGFPVVTQQKIADGGIPPERADFNGILNIYGQHIVHLNKGMPYEFDQDFANAIGGYPLHARIMLSDGQIAQNTIDGNTSNPSLAGTGWVIGISSSLVKNANGETQQKINDYIGVNWYAKAGGYAFGDRVRLLTGEIVQSTVESNINNPNVDMTGWSDKVGDASQIFDESGKTQQDFNNSTLSAIDNTYTKANVNELIEPKADKVYVDAQNELNAKKTELSLKADLIYVNDALSSLSTEATKFYPTLAEANADIANLLVNQPVQIGEVANGGLWYKATSSATSLTKSPYDPVQQSKSYTDEKTGFWQVQNITIKQFDSWSPYSVGFAGKNNLMPLGIKKDGTVVADKFNAEIIETTEQNIAGVKLKELSSFTGYVFGILGKNKAPFLVTNDGTIEIDRLEVNTLDVKPTGIVPAMHSGVSQEWWISPIHLKLNYPYERVVSALYSEKGEIIVAEYVVGQGSTKRYVLAKTTAIDDHNAPSIWMKEGRRTLVTWQQHNAKTYLECKVSTADGDIRTLEFATQQNIELGVAVSYSQIYHVESLSDESQDTFYILIRANSQQWHVVKISINQATGVISLLLNRQVWVASQQHYITSAQDGNKIRIACGYNPNVSQNHVIYYELDMNTGDIYNYLGAIVSNVNTGAGLPIWSDTAQSIAIPQTDSSTDRRLMYVRPAPSSPAILYAEWPISDPDSAVYKLAELVDSVWQYKDICQSGRRFGGTAEGNYLSGASFPIPCYKDELLIGRYDNAKNEGVLDRAIWNKTQYEFKEQVRVKNDFLIRPVAPQNGGYLCIYVQLYSYGVPDTFSFVSDTKLRFME